MYVEKNIIVGEDGIGFITQTGGSLTAVKQLTIGQQPGSGGLYQLSVPLVGNNNLIALQVLRDEVIGDAGNGEFVQKGAYHRVQRDLTIGKGAMGGKFEFAPFIDAVGNKSGGSLTVSGDETIGVDGHGEFVHTMGYHTVVGTLHMAVNSGSRADYTMTGTDYRGPIPYNSSVLQVKDLMVGENGEAHFIQNGGQVSVVGGGLLVGETYIAAGGAGTYVMDSGPPGGTVTSLTTGRLDIGDHGGGELTINHGTVTISGSGGTLSQPDISIGANGHGVINIHAGFILAETANALVGDVGQGQISQDGGQIELKSLTLGGWREPDGNGGYSFGRGLYFMSGTDSKLTVTGNEIIADKGLATFSQSGGVHSVQGNLTI